MSTSSLSSALRSGAWQPPWVERGVRCAVKYTQQIQEGQETFRHLIDRGRASACAPLARHWDTWNRQVVLLLLLLWQLARAHKPCWYRHPLHMGGNWLLFTYAEGVPVVRICGPSSFAFVLASGEESNIVVYDACEDAGVHNATTVVISSPKRSRYKEFQKAPDVALRYLPVWTLEELQACRSVCYAALSSDLVNSLFAYAGGIARVVLQDQKADDVVKAVLSADLYKMLAATAQPDTGDDMCHRLLHIHPEADLQTTRVTFPSTDVAAKIAERLVLDQSLFSRWFIATVDTPSLQTYRASFLKRRPTSCYVRRRVPHSTAGRGTSGTKRKGDEAMGTVTLSPSPHDASMRDAKAAVPQRLIRTCAPSEKPFRAWMLCCPPTGVLPDDGGREHLCSLNHCKI